MRSIPSCYFRFQERSLSSVRKLFSSLPFKVYLLPPTQRHLNPFSYCYFRRVRLGLFSSFLAFSTVCALHSEKKFSCEDITVSQTENFICCGFTGPWLPWWCHDVIKWFRSLLEDKLKKSQQLALVIITVRGTFVFLKTALIGSIRVHLD